MNKRTLILLSALALLLLAYFLLRRNTGNTLTGSDRDFEFRSTEKIDQIFMSNKFTKEYVLLKKTAQKQWSVNDTFPASIWQIDILLESLRKMRIKRPAARSEIDRVRKNIALNGTKVEIYEQGKLSKVFYVGNNTPDEMGTFFLMENGKEPYVCHIPGFNGYLSARFFTRKDGWRSKTIFALKEEQIREIQIDWTLDPGASFLIRNEGNEPVISSGSRQLANNREVNLNSLRAYLKLWENLSFEGFPIDLDARKTDSIWRTVPLLSIRVTDKNGVSSNLKIHKKGIKRDSNIQFDEAGNPLPFDIENYYAFINGNRKEIVQIQDYVFGKVMKKTSDFLIRN